MKIFVEIGPRSRTISTYNTCWYCYYGVISPHTVCCGPCGPGSIALAVGSSYSPCFFIEWYQNFNILHHLIGLNFPIFVISYSGHCPLLRLQTRQILWAVKPDCSFPQNYDNLAEATFSGNTNIWWWWNSCNLFCSLENRREWAEKRICLYDQSTSTQLNRVSYLLNFYRFIRFHVRYCGVEGNLNFLTLVRALRRFVRIFDHPRSL